MSTAVLLALIALSPSAAADPLLGLELGTNASLVKIRFANQNATLRWHDKDTPQALRKGLIETHFLAALAAAEATPKTKDGRLDIDAFHRVATAKSGRHRYALAFNAKGQLTALAVWVSVPVRTRLDSQRGWAPGRLENRRAVLNALKRYRIRPTETDRYGNRFAWRGRAARGRVHVRYAPETDEMRIVLAK